jgi:hypothetical protein
LSLQHLYLPLQGRALFAQPGNVGFRRGDQRPRCAGLGQQLARSLQVRSVARHFLGELVPLAQLTRTQYRRTGLLFDAADPFARDGRLAAECRALPRPPLLHQQRLAGTAHPASSSAGWLAKGPRNSRFIGDNGRGGLPLLLQPPVALFKVVACTLRGLVDLGSALRLSQHFGGSESGGTCQAA